MPECVRMYVSGSVKSGTEVLGKVGTGLLDSFMFLEIKYREFVGVQRGISWGLVRSGSDVLAQGCRG